MIIKLMMKLIYIKYFIRYLLINLFTAKEHGYLALVDDRPKVIPIKDNNEEEAVSFEEYKHMIAIENESGLDELFLQIYSDKNLNNDERFELEAIMNMI